jgi:hypothetical protein
VLFREACQIQRALASAVSAEPTGELRAGRCSSCICILSAGRTFRDGEPGSRKHS